MAHGLLGLGAYEGPKTTCCSWFDPFTTWAPETDLNGGGQAWAVSTFTHLPTQP